MHAADFPVPIPFQLSISHVCYRVAYQSVSITPEMMRRHLQDDREDSRRRRGKHTQGRDGSGRGGGVRKAARRGQAVRSGTPQAPLAEGWYEAWDENLGRPYYFRYDPDQSVWDRRLATAPEVVDSGSSAHADEVRGHEPVRSNEPSTPRVVNESMTHATSPARIAVVQANSPVPSPTSDIFAQPTHLNPLAPTAQGRQGPGFCSRTPRHPKVKQALLLRLHATRKGQQLRKIDKHWQI